MCLASLGLLPKGIKTEVRKRRKPPSYVLTNAKHMEFITSGKKEKASGKPVVMNTESQSKMKESKLVKVAVREKAKDSGNRKQVQRNKQKQRKTLKKVIFKMRVLYRRMKTEKLMM